MAVTLIRHTTPLVATGICYGRTDLGLSDSFHEEAAAVVSKVSKIERLYSSPLLRCRALAQKLAGTCDQIPTVQSCWTEMDFGLWEMTPWDEVPRHELDAWAGDFMNFDGHQGESVSALLSRVTTGLSNLPDGSVVVTHAGVIKAALAACGVSDAWSAGTGYGAAVTIPVEQMRMGVLPTPGPGASES